MLNQNNLNIQVTIDGIICEAKRIFVRGNKGTIKRAFRCISGPKRGKSVKKPSDCFVRKNLKRVKAGKRSARKTKFIRARHAKITRAKSLSKRIRRLNSR